MSEPAVCEFGNGCTEEPVAHYEAEFWSGPGVNMHVCRRHLITLLSAAIVHLPYYEGPARATWWIFETDIEFDHEAV
jgi:hypothetical protein